MGSHLSDQAASREALDSLRRLVRALRESGTRAERGVGLSGAQLFALQQFQDQGALSVGELAVRTLTHQSSVSVVAQRLVARGLLLRRRSPSDGRRVELYLSARGKALLHKAPPTAQAALAQALLRLQRTSRTALLQGLRALVQEMGLPAGAPQMFFEEERRRG